MLRRERCRKEEEEEGAVLTAMLEMVSTFLPVSAATLSDENDAPTATACGAGGALSSSRSAAASTVTASCVGGGGATATTAGGG